jgi:hypothetical protein
LLKWAAILLFVIVFRNREDELKRQTLPCCSRIDKRAALLNFHTKSLKYLGKERLTWPS